MTITKQKLYKVSYSITHHVFGEESRLITRNCTEEVLACSAKDAMEQVSQPPFLMAIHSVEKLGDLEDERENIQY